MRIALAICLLVGCGGKKPDTGQPVRSGDAADALWALAPPGVIAAEVLTPHGMAILDHGFERVQKLMKAVPDVGTLLGPMLAGVVTLLGSEHLADAGLSDELGLAIFGTPKDALAILPVGDRTKFLASVRGTTEGDHDLVQGLTCKQLPAGYACAKSAALFEQIGKGSLKGKLAAAGARGDLEVYVGPGLFGAGLTEGYFTAILDDGVLDATGFLAGKLAPLVPLVGVEALPPDSNGGGFLLANFAPGLAELGSRSVIAGVAKAIKGPVAATMAADKLAFQARVPLNDPAPVKALLDNCDAFGALIRLPAKAANGACHVTVPGALVPIGFDAWLDGNELRLGNAKGEFSAVDGKPRTAIGNELASGAWPYAMWGRGTLFGTNIASSLGPLPDPSFAKQLALAVRILAQLTEVGMGVRVAADGVHLRLYGRTIWTNPTEVAEAVAAISADDVMSGKGDQVALDLAKAHPGTPFAADLDSGRGLMMPVATIGVLSAVAIPAFMDYMKKSKQTEAAMMLNRLGKSAKVAYITDAKFPVGTVPLTPAASCCAGPKAHCVSTPADWATPVWTQLGFSIDDPNLFQYSYTSDGTTFTAEAVGDLDCDGKMITYRLEGSAVKGNPEVRLTEPPPNSD
jgi:type II secretory pathway pseudopilin PulG